MKYRKSQFKSLPATDLAKLTYLELLVNDITESSIAVFAQDVMKMTTKDWLLLFGQLPLFLLIPLVSWSDFVDIQKGVNKAGYWNYSNYIIYWRDVEDFDTKPYRQNKSKEEKT